MSLAQKLTPRIVTQLLYVLSDVDGRKFRTAQLMFACLMDFSYTPLSMFACLMDFSYTPLSEASEFILHLHELASADDFVNVSLKLLFDFNDICTDLEGLQTSIVKWLKCRHFDSRPFILSESTLPLFRQVFGAPRLVDPGNLRHPIIVDALVAQNKRDFQQRHLFGQTEHTASFRYFPTSVQPYGYETSLVRRVSGKLLSFEEMGPTMIRRLILLRRSQAPPGVDFYDMLFTIFRFCPFAPLVEAVELILHIDMSEQQFENVALKYSFCFHCVSPEHNHTRPCTMCVQRRQSIFRSAKIEHVISSFVEWMMQRNRAASTFLRTDSTMWVFRQARLRFLPECSLLRSIDQLCNAPTVVEMRATNNSVALQAARPSQMASDSDSQLTSTSTTAATSIHSSTRTTPPKDSTASTSVSATPSTELKWQRETQPVNLAQQGAFDENQVQGQPQPQPQPQLQQHQNHDQNAFHWAVLQRLQVVASAQSTDVVCTQCDKKCTYPRTKAQAGDDVCVCSDAGFESMLADSDVAAVTADVATASNHQLTAFAAPTEPITDLPQWAAIMQSQIETLQKARAEDTAKFEKLKSEHTELKSDHTELKSEHTELKSEHTKLKSEHTAQLAPLLCTDFVVKLADLLQSVLHHSLKQNAQVNVASHSSVLQLQYSEKLKKLPVDDQILCNYLRVISRPRNSLAHPCELSSQNAEYQVVVSPKAKPLGQFLSWSTMIYQLRGAMHDDQLNKLFAELNRDDDTSLNRDNQPVSLQVSVLKSRPGSEIVCDALLLVREFVDNPKSNFPIQSEPMSAEDLDFIRSFSGQAASSSSK